MLSCFASCTLLTVTCCSECCLPSRLDFEALLVLLYIINIFVNGIESLQHDIGAISLKNVETLEVPTPLFVRHTRCFAPGCSLVRLQCEC